MKLRFNEGAIVKFELIDGESISGKVRKVHEDEVEVVEQIKIVQGNSHKYYDDRTVDGKEITHLNRQLIKSWKYVDPFVFPSGVEESLTDWFTGKDYTGSTINSYVNGVCKGDGKWCGDIEEHYPAALIIPQKEDDDALSFF